VNDENDDGSDEKNAGDGLRQETNVAIKDKNGTAARRDLFMLSSNSFALYFIINEPPAPPHRHILTARTE
jgi:hypothetical protein